MALACDPDGEVVTQVNKRERKMEGILGFSLVCLKKWREGKCRGWGFSTRTQQFSSVWIMVKKIRELRVNEITNLPLVYSSVESWSSSTSWLTSSHWICWFLWPSSFAHVTHPLPLILHSRIWLCLYIVHVKNIRQWAPIDRVVSVSLEMMKPFYFKCWNREISYWLTSNYILISLILPLSLSLSLSLSLMTSDLIKRIKRIWY